MPDSWVLHIEYNNVILRAFTLAHTHCIALYWSCETPLYLKYFNSSRWGTARQRIPLLKVLGNAFDFDWVASKITNSERWLKFHVHSLPLQPALWLPCVVRHSNGKAVSAPPGESRITGTASISFTLPSRPFPHLSYESLSDLSHCLSHSPPSHIPAPLSSPSFSLSLSLTFLFFYGTPHFLLYASPLLLPTHSISSILERKRNWGRCTCWVWHMVCIPCR